MFLSLQSLNDHRESSEMEANASPEAHSRHVLEHQSEAAIGENENSEVDTIGECGVL